MTIVDSNNDVIDGLPLRTTVKVRMTIGEKESKEIVHSAVTIDWEGVTILQLQELAQKTIIARSQAIDRKDGKDGKVPAAEYEIKASEFAQRRTRRTPSVEDMIGKLTPEQRAELFKKYLSN